MGAFTDYLKKDKKKTGGAFTSYLEKEPSTDIGNQFISAERQTVTTPPEPGYQKYIPQLFTQNAFNTDPFSGKPMGLSTQKPVISKVQYPAEEAKSKPFVPSDYGSYEEAVKATEAEAFQNSLKNLPVRTFTNYQRQGVDLKTPPLPQYSAQSPYTVGSYDYAKTPLGQLIQDPKRKVGEIYDSNLNVLKSFSAGAVDFFANANTALGDLSDLATGYTAYDERYRPYTDKGAQYKKDAAEMYAISKGIRDSMAQSSGRYEDLLIGAAGSIPTMIPPLVTGQLWTMIPSVYGASIKQARDQGKKGNDARLFAALNTGLELLTEKLPFDALMDIKRAGGKGLVANLFKEAGTEFLGEGTNQALAPFIERATIDPYAELSSLSDILDAGMTGALMAVMLGGSAMGINVTQATTNPTIENVMDVITQIEQKTGQKLPQETINNVMSSLETQQPSLNQNRAVVPVQSPVISATNNIGNISNQENVMTQPSANQPLAQPIYTTIQPTQENVLNQANIDAQTDIEPQLLQLESNLTPNNAQETIAKLEAMKNDPLMKMNLQKFAARIETLLSKAKAMYESIGGKEKLLSFPQGRLVDIKQDILDTITRDPMTYNEIKNVDTLAKADELIAQYPEAAKALINEDGNYNNVVESAVGMKVIQNMFKEARVNESLYDEVFALVEKHAQKLKASGQIIQMSSVWSKSTPEGMVKYVDKIIEDAKKQGYDIKVPEGFKKEIYEDMVAIEQMETIDGTIEYINKLYKDKTGKDIKQFVESNLSNKTQEKLKEIATDQVLMKVVDLAKPTFWQKVSTYQAISHLLNTKTASRNILSNFTMNQMERLVDTLAIPIDKILGKVTGKRSVSLPANQLSTLKPAISKAKDAATLIELGLPLDGNKYAVGQTFKKGPLAKAEKALRYELQVTDEFQKGAIEADIRSQFQRINNNKKLTAEQENVVQQEMRYRTFQDDTLLSKFLTEQKNTLNRIGVGKQQKGTGIDVNGKQRFGVHEFGAGDFIIKYTKVAGNIITRKIEYTPLGYIKALVNLSRLKNGDLQTQRNAATSFARATTGASMMAMGAILRNLGLIIRQDDEAKGSQSALEKAAGLGNYKFNISGATRLLSGESPELQKGDTLVTYNWIEPIGSSFTIGAAIYDTAKKNGTATEIALDALNQTLEESLDISTLSMIKSMTYAQSPIDVLITPLASNVSGFVPSPVRQAANVIDPTMRSKYSGAPLERSFKQLLGSLPFASKTIEPYLSPVGQERTNNTGLGGMLLSQLSPLTITQYQPSPILEPLIKLSEIAITNDLGDIPWPSLKAPATLKLDDELVKLTDEQKTVYLEAKGQFTEKEFKKILPTNPSVASDERIKELIKELNKILTESIDVGKEAVLDMD